MHGSAINDGHPGPDPENLALLGSKARQAQLRHYGRGPAYFRLGRKIVYHGADLNAWANARRVSSQEEG
ncbi:MAG: hypothetical protein P8X66_01885 [Maritimibacter sp.]